MDETGPMDLILVLGWNYREGRPLFYLHLKLTGSEPGTSMYHCMERPCLRGWQSRAERQTDPKDIV